MKLSEELEVAIAKLDNIDILLKWAGKDELKDSTTNAINALMRVKDELIKQEEN